MSLIKNENTQAKDAWNRNAEFWNERMGEGNDFFNILLWRAVERLLKPQPGERFLDVACGNGLTSRRLATAKARVTAVDVSDAMITIASGHPAPLNIDYRVVDATDREALLGLGASAFDGALCNMALMDMAEIEPLMTALAVLLADGSYSLFFTPASTIPPPSKWANWKTRMALLSPRTP
jgi:2-polyprenyl-3-methyl-5-hydroxy-6-metoxy-1,4-benzoquinol methylase